MSAYSKIKRLLASAMSVLMLLTLLPTAALADGEPNITLDFGDVQWVNAEDDEDLASIKSLAGKRVLVVPVLLSTGDGSALTLGGVTLDIDFNGEGAVLYYDAIRGTRGFVTALSDLEDPEVTVNGKAKDKVNEDGSARMMVTQSDGLNFTIEDEDGKADGYTIAKFVFFHMPEGSEAGDTTTLSFGSGTMLAYYNDAGISTKYANVTLGGSVTTPKDGPKEVTVTLNPNGAPGETVQTYTDAVGTSFSLYPAPFTWDGYELVSWNTKEDGSGTTYNSTTITMTEDLTLYAIWQEIVESTFITYAPNGADGDPEAYRAMVAPNANYTLDANQYVRDGYTFTGWNTAADGSGTSYADKATVYVTGSITLYAQWKKEIVEPAVTLRFGDMQWMDAEEFEDLALYPSLAGKRFLEVPIIMTTGDGTMLPLIAGDIGLVFNQNGKVLSYDLIKDDEGEEAGFIAQLGELSLDNPDPKTVNDSGELHLIFKPSENVEKNVNIKSGVIIGWVYFYHADGSAADGTTAISFVSGTKLSYWNEDKNTQDYTSVTLGESVTTPVDETDEPEPEKVTVTLDADGGTGSVDHVDGEAGKAISLPMDGFTKEGFKFTGWKDSDGNSYTDSITTDKDITLTAQWEEEEPEPEDVIITLKANGGIGDDVRVTGTAGKDFFLPNNTFTRDGCTFTGWNTDANGHGDSYKDGDTVNTAEDLTLYAQWENVLYTITYKPNGPTAEDQTEKALAGDWPLTGNSFEWPDHVFDGWNTKADGTGDAYADRGTVTITGDLTLYAQWKDVETGTQFTVTLDPNGADGNPEAEIVNAPNGEIKLPANKFQKLGFTFDGWNTAENGSGDSYGDMDVVRFSKDVTLYAQWKSAAKYTVSFDAGEGSGTMASQEATNGVPFRVPENNGLKGPADKPTFVSWIMNGNLVQPGELVTVTGDVTMTANWAAKNGCYVATAVYGSYDCPEVWTLRRFRDKVLARTWYGRLFIRLYYAVSPTAVRLFGDMEWFQNFWRGHLDTMVGNLQANGFESTPYQDRPW